MSQIKYYPEIPPFIKEASQTPEMLRLKDVGMHCGLEYASFTEYKKLKAYSRYEHSLGVALIVWNFTQDKAQSLAGLFHDIATPCFAHVVDFLHGDYENQESTEEKTTAIIDHSKEIQQILKKLNITTAQVADYHLYPIADNDSPKLSADRLEYTLGNFYNYQNLPLTKIQEMYDDLEVMKNETNEAELGFKHEDKAFEFVKYMLKNSYMYSADPDRYAMETLARLLRDAIKDQVIKEEDLYLIEPELIKKLTSDPRYLERWKAYRKLSKVVRSDKEVEGSLKINAKHRYIDPLSTKGRVSLIDRELKEEIDKYSNLSFDYWLVARS